MKETSAKDNKNENGWWWRMDLWPLALLLINIIDMLCLHSNDILRPFCSFFHSLRFLQESLLSPWTQINESERGDLCNFLLIEGWKKRDRGGRNNKAMGRRKEKESWMSDTTILGQQRKIAAIAIVPMCSLIVSLVLIVCNALCISTYPDNVYWDLLNLERNV